MGTECWIGLEDKDGIVRYVSVHFDGYFENIIPILRLYYQNRDEVEKLISAGNQRSLTIPEHLEQQTDEDKVCEMVTLRWQFEVEVQKRRTLFYWYLFTQDDVWECQTKWMININQFKEYPEK